LAKGICPECGEPMEVRPNKITRKKEEGGEISGKVYACKNCKGVFIPESVFGVH